MPFWAAFTLAINIPTRSAIRLMPASLRNWGSISPSAPRRPATHFALPPESVDFQIGGSVMEIRNRRRDRIQLQRLAAELQHFSPGQQCLPNKSKPAYSRAERRKPSSTRMRAWSLSFSATQDRYSHPNIPAIAISHIELMRNIRRSSALTPAIIPVGTSTIAARPSCQATTPMSASDPTT